jgi:type IV secretion system protein TrbI
MSVNDPATYESVVPASGTAAAMRLRAETPTVTRISRKVLSAVCVTAGLTIGGAFIYALQPNERTRAQDELFTTDRRQTAEGLQNLPRDYTGIPQPNVPQLGPPLPGDLGGPILRAREEGRPIPAEPLPMLEIDPEEQRRLAEMEAARTSQLFFQIRSDLGSGLPSEHPGSSPSPAVQGSVPDRHRAFLNAEVDRRTVASDRVAPPASPYLLQAGSVVPAALMTGIRSDLPGQIIAQVTQHVYDSLTGSLLLIPQGSRLIGQYDAGMTIGQRRALLVWNRLIFPDGRSIVLERQPGADATGYAGVEDGVDHHWWDVARAAALSTLLAASTELTTSDENRFIEAIRNGAGDTISDAGQQLVQRQLQIAPTLTIRPGFPVRVIVTRDLVLEPFGATR